MTSRRADRPGAAALALLLILVITAGWWALALWPAGDAAPEWLLRTRAACFGSVRGGLPSTGGWILLVGQPLGMLGFLLTVWGDTLAGELRRLGTDGRWRLAGAGLGGLLLAGAWFAGRRVAFAVALAAAQRSSAPGVPSRVDLDVSRITLTDQYGQRHWLAERHGQPALLTFAYGHCSTVCPTLLHELRTARLAANRPELPILVVTLDPWRDTPDRLSSLASQWGLGAEDRVLSGSVAEVERALDRLGIGRRRDETTGDLEHGGAAMLLDQRGHVVWRVDGGWGGVKDLLARQP